MFRQESSAPDCLDESADAVCPRADDVRAGMADGLKMRWNPRNMIGAFEVVLPASHFAEMAEALAR